MDRWNPGMFWRVQRYAMRNILFFATLLTGALQAQDHGLVAGIQALARNDHQAAEMALSVVLEASPADERAWYYRGVSRIGTGDAEGALRDLDRMLQLVPNDPHGLLRRAEAYELLGEVAAARRDLNALLLRSTNGPAAEQALEMLGGYAMREGDLYTALKHYDAWVEASPHDARALAYRGAVLGTMGRYNEAAIDLDLSLDRDPGLTMALAARAENFLRQGRKQEACHDLQQALMLGDRSVEERLLIHCER